MGKCLEHVIGGSCWQYVSYQRTTVEHYYAGGEKAGDMAGGIGWEGIRYWLFTLEPLKDMKRIQWPTDGSLLSTWASMQDQL